MREVTGQFNAGAAEPVLVLRVVSAEPAVAGVLVDADAPEPAGGGLPAGCLDAEELPDGLAGRSGHVSPPRMVSMAPSDPMPRIRM